MPPWRLKTAADLAVLTARLEAAPFQNRGTGPKGFSGHANPWDRVSPKWRAPWPLARSGRPGSPPPELLAHECTRPL